MFCQRLLGASGIGGREARMRITEVSAYPVWAGSRNFLFVVVDTDDHE
jgi:hypothetical protein